MYHIRMVKERSEKGGPVDLYEVQGYHYGSEHLEEKARFRSFEDAFLFLKQLAEQKRHKGMIVDVTFNPDTIGEFLQSVKLFS